MGTLDKNLGLFTNRNSRKDYIVNAIDSFTAKPCNVYIAVAFFTESKVVERILQKGCHVRLIVRLGFPTQPAALEKFLETPGIELRYFTDTAFHPKIYIFGNQIALVGSANLTQAAIHSNQEVVVSIGSDDTRLNELASLFSEYWAQAKVLTRATLNEYKTIVTKLGQTMAQQNKAEQEIISKLGRVFAGDIIKDKYKQTKENIFLEGFRKTYQEFVTAFNIIRKIYEDVGKRKIIRGNIPLRLEIDSFISFVREKYAYGENWESTPFLNSEDQKKLIEPLILEWLITPWPHFEEKIVKENYPKLQIVFSTPESISESVDDQLFDALCSAHSFHDRFRFFLGGMASWKNEFLKANDPKRLRESLTYLLFGEDNIEERMANLIYNPTYKLNEFGQSNVQELIGWLNKEELPVVNSRTTKVMRYFGFDITQVG